MRKLLALAFFVLSVANANAQAISVSPSGGGGTPGGAANTVQYNSAGVFGGMSGTSWDDTNRTLGIAGGTITTTSKPILNLTQTWNDAAVTFTGFNFDVTDTASSSTALIFNLSRLGTSRFSVDKFGKVATPGDFYMTAVGGRIFFRNGATTLTSNAAASLQLGTADSAAPTAQTLGVQSVLAGTSNTAGVNWTIRGSAGTGTGTGGSIIFQTAPADGSGTAQNAFVTAVTIDSPGTLRVKGFTVATLPAAGTAGRIAYVSDQLTACPALGGTFTGGGVVVCKAFDDGTNWTHQ